MKMKRLFKNIFLFFLNLNKKPLDHLNRGL